MMKEPNKPTMESLEQLEKKKKSALVGIIKEHRNYVVYMESKLSNVKEMLDDFKDDLATVQRTERANKEENEIALRMLSDIKVSIKTVMQMKFTNEVGDLPMKVDTNQGKYYQPWVVSETLEKGDSVYSEEEQEIINLLKSLHEMASV